MDQTALFKLSYGLYVVGVKMEIPSAAVLWMR